MSNLLRILETTNMARRKTPGTALRDIRIKAELSIDALADAIKKKGLGDIGSSTIRQIEAGVTTNPGIKTLEQIALGLEQSPLEIIATWLADPPPESKQRFTRSRFAIAADVYEALPPGRKVWYDDMLEMVIERMKKG